MAMAMAATTPSAFSATFLPNHHTSTLLSNHRPCPQTRLLALFGAPSPSLPRISFAASTPRTRCPSSALAPLRAVATSQHPPAAQPSSSDLDVPPQMTKYHFLIANAKFMLDDEEHFQEQLKERLRLYGERQMERDFWLVIEPKFLENFPDIAKRLKRPAVALVSTNNRWITFMKLRLDRVLRGEFEVGTLAEALQSTPVDLQFEKPETWTAPYPKYEGDWWTPFLLPQ